MGETRKTSIIYEIKDKATQVLDKVGFSLGNLGSKLQKGGISLGFFTKKLGVMGAALKITKIPTLLLAAGLLKLGSVLKKIGHVMVENSGEMESWKISLTTMTGSVLRATELIKELKQVTLETPFTLPEIVQNTKQLIGMGIETDKAVGYMKMLGDVSAGLDVPIARLALNFGQVRTQTRLTGRELRDFAFAGVPIIQELSKNLNVSEKAIKDLVSAGDVSFQDVVDAFKSMTSEGGRFFDLMSKKSRTWKGVLSLIKDDLFQLSANLGELTIFKPVKTILMGIESLLRKISKLSQVILDEVQKTKNEYEVMGDIVKKLGLNIDPAIKKTKELLKVMSAASGGGISLDFKALNEGELEALIKKTKQEMKGLTKELKLPRLNKNELRDDLKNLKQIVVDAEDELNRIKKEKDKKAREEKLALEKEKLAKETAEKNKKLREQFNLEIKEYQLKIAKLRALRDVDAKEEVNALNKLLTKYKENSEIRIILELKIANLKAGIRQQEEAEEEKANKKTKDELEDLAKYIVNNAKKIADTGYESEKERLKQIEENYRNHKEELANIDLEHLRTLEDLQIDFDNRRFSSIKDRRDAEIKLQEDIERADRRKNRAIADADTLLKKQQAENNQGFWHGVIEGTKNVLKAIIDAEVIKADTANWLDALSRAAQTQGFSLITGALQSMAIQTAGALGKGAIDTIQFANGGLVEPTTRGTQVTMGEAGETELGLPSSKVKAFLDEAGVSSDSDRPINIYLDGKQIAKSTTKYQTQFGKTKEY